MMWNLIDYLREPQLDGLDVDSEERIELHAQALNRKRMLRTVFQEFHKQFKRLEGHFFSGEGVEVEIGAGVAPIRDSFPEVLATDVVKSQNLDRVINAESMDFNDGEVHAIYGQNCFHHFPHPERFFKELERVLAPGGGAVLLEPYHGPFASFLYKRLFKTEGFDKNYDSWEVPVSGPMNGANQALSYIVFVRDRDIFERKFPSLQIVHQELAGNYLKYLISGGLNFKQLLPDSFTGFIGLVEKILSPFNRWISLHHVVVIKRR